MAIPKLIEGDKHQDNRGVLAYINDFNMHSIVRFYLITNVDTELKRGWTGHKIEQRWFYVPNGECEISVAKVVELENSDYKNILRFRLSEQKSQVLHVPPGYATLIQSCLKDSSVIVFADHGMSTASEDQYIFPVNDEK